MATATAAAIAVAVAVVGCCGAHSGVVMLEPALLQNLGCSWIRQAI